jgi:HlyD family secretion protein
MAGVVAALLAVGCRHEVAPAAPRASGYVEATEVRMASKVPGRVTQVTVTEGARIDAGQTLVILATTDTDLALRQAHAERDQASAQWRLLRAGSRAEDIQQAEALFAAATADRRAVEADLDGAKADEARFEQLLRAHAGSEKQRDDAVSRRMRVEAQLKATEDRARAASATLDRLNAGARPEEVEAAAARVAAADARIATLQQNRADATILAPVSGTVSTRLIEPGELVAAGTPLVVIVDLDHAWASAYVEEPLVPGLKLDQAATVVTDAGDRLPGRLAFISPKAEFTPRNVQTSDERAKLVYRVKVMVDNHLGVLKPGMPVEVEFGGPVR